MYKLPFYIFFFVAVAFFISYGLDIGKTSYSKEEFRGGNMAVSEAIAIRHMDWGSLRVGHSPRLMKTMVYEDGSKIPLERTIGFVLGHNTNLPVENMKVELLFHPDPAMVGVLTETNFESSASSLLGAENIEHNVPNRSVHIIESIHDNYNY